MRHQILIMTTLVATGACASSRAPAAPPPAPASSREPQVAPNAPKDAEVAVTDQATAALNALLAPCVARARATYPGALKRFKAWLPAGESFFVVTVLHDMTGRFEQVFVAVDSVTPALIYGRIWSPIELVQGYRLKQPYHFPESAMVDWLISKPDGSEEGNWSGKFMDAMREKGSPPTGMC
jgi:hypothetical protein